jgi:hypothetical protein
MRMVMHSGVLITRMIVVMASITMSIHMDPPVEMFGLTPHQSRADLGLDGKTAALIQAPLEHRTKQAINGVVPWLPLKVVLQPCMPLQRDDRTHPEIARAELFTAWCTMGPGRYR